MFKTVADFILSIPKEITDLAFAIRDGVEANLVVLQTISFFISTILLIGIIYALIKSGYFDYKTERMMDALMVGDLPRRRSIKGWQEIMKKMGGKKEEDWQAALVIADNILGEVLKLAGYYGKNLTDRLDNITPAQMSHILELRQAHQLTQRARKEDFSASKAEISEAIYIYRKTFQELRLL
jgi:hypothetical protein